MPVRTVGFNSEVSDWLSFPENLTFLTLIHAPAVSLITTGSVLSVVSNVTSAVFESSMLKFVVNGSRLEIAFTPLLVPPVLSIVTEFSSTSSLSTHRLL